LDFLLIDTLVSAEEERRVDEGHGVVDERKELGRAREVGTSSANVTCGLNTTFPDDTGSLQS
jgi:hypothetical protein